LLRKANANDKITAHQCHDAKKNDMATELIRVVAC
jgi:hypothetical protein